MCAPFRYDQPFPKIIHQIKFGSKIQYTKLLGELLAENLVKYYKGADMPEVIIPVPLHAKRQSKRGFNQAEEIAKYVACGLGIRLDKTSVLRVKHTSAQATLEKVQRQRNLNGAFKVDLSSKYRYVALLDDVVTTGSTVKAVSCVLKDAEVERVDVWSVCRG